MRLLDILFDLRRACLKANIEPSDIKITIEFLTPKARTMAEYAIKTALQAPEATMTVPPRTFDDAFAGRPFKLLGIPLEVKSPSWFCSCAFCQMKREQDAISSSRL